MGRKNLIKILASSVALVSVHKLLEEYGTKPESKKHILDEIRDYSIDAFDKAQLRNWRKDELKEIREIAINKTLARLKKYKDIELNELSIKECVIDTMQELLLI